MVIQQRDATPVQPTDYVPAGPAVGAIAGSSPQQRGGSNQAVFDRAAAYVFEKNEELYKRLA